MRSPRPVAAVGRSVGMAIVVRPAPARGIVVVILVVFLCVVVLDRCMSSTRCNNIECLSPSKARCRRPGGFQGIFSVLIGGLRTLEDVDEVSAL